MSAHSDITILKTKLSIPQVKTPSVLRSQLITKLRNTWHVPLTLISAGAGFGKTTLLSSWVENCPHHIVWQSLDKNDNDPTCFMTYLIHGLRNWRSQIGIVALKLLQVPEPPPLESILALLINDISDAKEKIGLILEDYHIISSSKIDKAVNFIVEYRPDNFHLIISTRSDPNLPVARWRAQNQLNEIRSADLSFTQNETAIFLNENLKLNLSDADIELLTAKTEGWVTGIQLAALSLKNRPERSVFLAGFRGDNRYIVDYLAEEVLSDQSEQIKNFLLFTAILDHLHADLCRACTGMTNSQKILEELERQNLFLFSIDDERYWFRYHQLFKDVLIQKLQQLPQSDQTIRELHRRAAGWYEQSAMEDEAIEHYLNASNYDRAAILIEKRAEIKWLAGQQFKLLHWLESLPAEHLEKKPHLAVFYARELFMSGRRDEADNVLNQAELKLNSKKAVSVQKTANGLELNIEQQKGRIAVVRSIMASYRGQIGRVIDFAEQGQKLLHQQDDRWQNLATITLGIANGWSGYGRFRQSYVCFDRGLKLSDKIGDDYLYLFCGLCKASLEMQQARPKSSTKLYQHLIDFAENKGLKRSGINGALYCGYAAALLEMGQFRQAQQKQETGSKLANDGHDPVMRASAQLTSLRMAFYTKNYSKALEIIHHMQSAPSFHLIPPWIKHVLAAAKAWCWLQNGDFSTVEKWIKEYKIGQQDSELVWQEMAYTVYARYLLAREKYQQLYLLLDHLIEKARSGNRESRVIELLIIRSMGLFSEEQITDAVKLLCEAIKKAQQEEMIMVFVHEGRPVKEMLDLIIAERNNVDCNKDSKAAEFLSKLSALFSDSEAGLEKNTKPFTLSKREQEVLTYISEGLTNQQIADRLYVSLNTIRSHTKKINQKLGVHSRLKAISRARELGLIGD